MKIKFKLSFWHTFLLFIAIVVLALDGWLLSLIILGIVSMNYDTVAAKDAFINIDYDSKRKDNV